MNERLPDLTRFRMILLQCHEYYAQLITKLFTTIIIKLFFFLFQVTIYQFNLKECLSSLFGVPESTINVTHMTWANISLGSEFSVCNPDHQTSHFPEVHICLN